MDAKRFDAIAKVLITETTRRRPLAALLGGTLALLGLAHPDDGAAASGKCKPTCGTCRRCKKGKCKKTKRGKTCKKGKCQPRPNGTACGECQACQRGTCRVAANGTGCGEGRDCQDGTCHLRCGAGGPCRAFVTSSTHTGNLGGLAGADTICQQLADDPAVRLPGTYKAWLSTATESPSTRFTSTETTGPYVLVDGTRIASSFGDLTDGTLAASIDLTEGDGRVEASTVWTFTKDDGTPADTQNLHCTSWSREAGLGVVGTTDRTTNGWSLFLAVLPECHTMQRLYCFQQG
ncbi:MAG: DUF1554 domain-containing protein [Chloroflexota bacterium]|nr:DUF1554 domain-containing protein [Chloroflexota bacterium]